MKSLGFSIYSVMSSAKNDTFTSFFPVWMTFISSCMISVPQVSSIKLNKSGESGLSCLVPDLKENTFSFCSLSMMLTMGFPYDI